MVYVFADVAVPRAQNGVWLADTSVNASLISVFVSLVGTNWVSTYFDAPTVTYSYLTSQGITSCSRRKNLICPFHSAGTLKTRFVVDVASGISATSSQALQLAGLPASPAQFPWAT